jgi:hypothetical protein
MGQARRVSWAGALDVAVRVAVLVSFVIMALGFVRIERESGERRALQDCLITYVNEDARVRAERTRLADEDRKIAKAEQIALDGAFLAVTDPEPSREAIRAALQAYVDARRAGDEQRQKNDAIRAANPLPEAPALRCSEN